MNHELIKASLNLNAVLQNLEELVAYDATVGDLARAWNVAIQFSVLNGPAAYVEFKEGHCRVGRGKHAAPNVRLFFTSAAHLNRMMDGKGNPIPLKGFTRLGFLTKEFPKATDRLEYYLKPTDALLKDEQYLALNTRMTLNTAAFAVKELARLDTIGQLNAAHIQDGIVLLKILPDGPAANIKFAAGTIEVSKGDVAKPTAMLLFKDFEIANRFLNGKMDVFSAVAAGDVMIRGQSMMLDSLGLILDRVPVYLS